MRCREAQKLVLRLVDGSLNDDAVARLKLHTDVCDACRRELEGLRSTVDALDRWESHTPSRGFADLHELIGRSKLTTISPRLHVRLSQGWLLAGLAGVSLLVGITAGVVTRPHELARPQPTEMAAIQAIDAVSFENLVDGSLIYSLTEGADVGGRAR